MGMTISGSALSITWRKSSGEAWPLVCSGSQVPVSARKSGMVLPGFRAVAVPHGIEDNTLRRVKLTDHGFKLPVGADKHQSAQRLKPWKQVIAINGQLWHLIKCRNTGPMLRDGLNQCFLIVVTDTVFPIGALPAPVQKSGQGWWSRTARTHIYIAANTFSRAFLQIPFCHHCAIRAGHRRSLGDDGINLADSSIQNLVHRSAAHTVQSEIAGVKNTLAVCFDQKEIAVTGRVVNTKGCDLDVANEKRFARREGLNGLHPSGECVIFMPCHVLLTGA